MLGMLLNRQNPSSSMLEPSAALDCLGITCLKIDLLTWLFYCLVLLNREYLCWLRVTRGGR